jgi:hypothetical protein
MRVAVHVGDGDADVRGYIWWDELWLGRVALRRRRFSVMGKVVVVMSSSARRHRLTCRCAVLAARCWLRGVGCAVLAAARVAMRGWLYQLQEAFD